MEHNATQTYSNAPTTLGRYGTANGEGTEMLPEDIVTAAAKYAQGESEKGRLIPNEKMYELVAERLGWM